MPTQIQRLIYAVRRGHLDQLRKLLAKTEDLSIRSAAGRSALHAAAEEGNTEAAAILLDAGIPPDVRTKDGETPLHLAARCGRGWDLADPDLDRRNPCDGSRKPINRRVAEAILTILRKRNPDALTSTGLDDPLGPETKLGTMIDVWELMSERKELLKELEILEIDVAALDPQFAEQLRGNPRFLKVAPLLLERGADINALDLHGKSPLSVAAEYGELEMIELLLSRGADPNLHDPTNQRNTHTPIETAIDRYRFDAARLLWSGGAKLDFEKTFPLHTAASNGQLELLLWLMERGGDINQRSKGGDAPIWSAARCGHGKIVEALRDNGAELHGRDKDNRSLLHLAAGWKECLQPLLASDLSVDDRDNKGWTPLHFAAVSQETECIRLLLASGADINAQNNDGNTPLQIVFFGEELRPDIELPVFQCLIDARANRNLRNNNGQTACDIARSHQYPEEYLNLLNPQ